MSKVEIGKTVDYPTLEKALIKAAEEVGLRATVKDKFEKGYKLGSLEETSTYSHTLISIGGILFPAMTLYLGDKNSRDCFIVWSGFPHGFASTGRVREYLNAVSKNL